MQVSVSLSPSPIIIFPHASLYLACAGVLVLVGALDDRFDISVRIRAVIQAAIAVIMMMAGNLHLSSLGFIFGSWELVLGPFGFFLTLFAVWAAINAFNMVDGIDGLLGGTVIGLFCGDRDYPLV